MSSRRGLSLIEVIVAAGLLVTTLAITSKLIVATGRLSQQARHHRIALEEATNLLERVRSGALDAENASDGPALLPPLVTETLPNVTLEQRRIQDDLGDRLEVIIRWGDTRKLQEIRLLGWIQNESFTPSNPQIEGGEA